MKPWIVPDPWELDAAEKAIEERRQRRAAYYRMWRNRPENRVRRREYNRRWMASKRTQQQRVGWLHELACTGNHRGHTACRPIAVFGGEG